MSEMVSKLAQALFDTDGRWSCEFREASWDEADSPQEYFTKLARAAIEAMREPTADVLAHMATSDVDGVCDLAVMWRDAIEAALNGLSPEVIAAQKHRAAIVGALASNKPQAG